MQAIARNTMSPAQSVALGIQDARHSGTPAEGARISHPFGEQH